MLARLLVASAVFSVGGIAVTRRCARGRLTRASSAGISTRHTTASDASWEAGHAAALPLIIRTGWIVGLTVVMAVLVQISLGEQPAVLVAAGGLAAQVVMVFFAIAAATRAAQVLSLRP